MQEQRLQSFAPLPDKYRQHLKELCYLLSHPKNTFSLKLDLAIQDEKEIKIERYLLRSNRPQPIIKVDKNPINTNRDVKDYTAAITDFRRWTL
jgi:hypothetical protein